MCAKVLEFEIIVCLRRAAINSNLSQTLRTPYEKQKHFRINFNKM